METKITKKSWLAVRRAKFEKRFGLMDEVVGPDSWYQEFVLATGGPPRRREQMIGDVRKHYCQYRFAQSFAFVMRAVVTHPVERTDHQAKMVAWIDRLLCAPGKTLDRMDTDPARWIYGVTQYVAKLAEHSED